MAAEKGAHLTNTVQSSPSLFEIISEENLAESLPQALEYAFKSAVIYHPSVEPIAKFFDEIYLLFDAAVQYHYMRTRGGTLSEAFYGLERFPRANFHKAYAAAVIAPYIKVKLKKFFQRLSEESEGAIKPGKRRILILKEYFMTALDVIRFYYAVMYTLGKTSSHSLLFSILGLKLVYAKPDAVKPGSRSTGLRWALSTIGNSILPILEIGSFAAQFMQWWNSQRATVVEALPVPEFYNAQLDLDPVKCPLCSQPRRNNTALSTSGIVFCYQCISRHLKVALTCPITGVPSKMDNLVRIYDE